MGSLVAANSQFEGSNLATCIRGAESQPLDQRGGDFITREVALIKATETFPLAYPGGWNSEIELLAALRRLKARGALWASLASGGAASPRHPLAMASQVQPLPQRRAPFSVCVSLSPFSPHKGASHTGLRTHLPPAKHRLN